MYYFAKDDYDQRSIKPYLFLLLGICLLIVDIILLILVIICFFGGFRSTIPEVLVSDDEGLSHDGANKYCESHDKSLPRPTNQKEEDEVVAKILNSTAKDCAFVFFAWVADNYEDRYQSLSNKELFWPSLRKKYDASIISTDRECYFLDVKAGFMPSPRGIERCGTLTHYTYDDLLMLKNESDEGVDCSKHVFSCFQCYQNVKTNISDSFNSGLQAVKGSYGVVPYDAEEPPHILFGVSCPIPWVPEVLAVRYKLRYRYKKKILPYYNSTRYIIIDPEYDCLAYQPETNILMTRHCDDPGCALCI